MFRSFFLNRIIKNPKQDMHLRVFLQNEENMKGFF